MTRYTYQALLELVEGDDEFIVRLVEERLIERHEDVVTLDIDRVLLARTLWRELEVDWPGIEIILRMTSELSDARARIVELEKKLGGNR